jgi:hypothetical protein
VQESAPLKFEVRLAPEIAPRPLSGRLWVVLDPGEGTEPRHALGRAGAGAVPTLGRDVDDWKPADPVIVDGRAASFPIATLGRLAPAEYNAQVVLHVNRDLNHPNAPGDLYGDPIRARLDPTASGTVRLTLNRRLPDEAVPEDTEQVRYLRLPSKRLSDFHGRPFFVRAAVILPRGFEREPGRRYPLRVHIGGYGARCTGAGALMAPGSSFAELWNAEDTPRLLRLHLDGAGPLGDPYQVNSANHGPYGDALLTELIPHVEDAFRGDGRRVVDGGSTGGWVSLALQVFYPDVFHGCWSSCPDPLDFRSFQRVNIYEDASAYVDAEGRERPACRDPRTDRVRYTMRHECGMENVLGRGDSYTDSGGQWGAWNATFGPRRADGRPAPLWDPKAGTIDKSLLEHWKQYDMSLVLTRRWPELAAKLRGKLRVWVGEADDFFLNEAVHRFEEAVTRLDPPWGGSITYGPGRGHCWSNLDEAALLRQMAEVTGATP